MGWVVIKSLLKLLVMPVRGWQKILSGEFYSDWLIGFLIFMSSTAILFRFVGDIGDGLDSILSLIDAVAFFVIVWGGAILAALLAKLAVCCGSSLRGAMKVGLFSTLPCALVFPMMLLPSLAFYRPLLMLPCLVWCGILLYTGMMQLRNEEDDDRFLLGMCCVYVPWMATSVLVPHFFWLYLCYGDFSYLIS